MHKRSLNVHLLTQKNAEHTWWKVGVMLQELVFTNLQVEVVTYLISRSLALTLMWSVRQNKSVKYIHYMQFYEGQCEMNSVQQSPDSKK